MDGEVKVPEQSKILKFWKKIASLFKNLWRNVISPALRRMCYDTVTTGMSEILNVNRASTFQQPPAPYSTSARPIVAKQRVRLDTRTNRFGVQQLVADDRRTLEDVLAKMRARINDPSSMGTVSIGEMYTYANIPARAEDCNEGWTNLEGCYIQFEPSVSGYTLQMSEQIRL